MTQEHPIPGLRTAREAARLTQKELAAAVHLSEHAVYLFERGTTSPSLDTAKALAAALGTTVGALLGETELPLAAGGEA